MIRKVGLDVVEVDRIREALEKPGFKERILTEREIEICKTPMQIAGRWAVKEAMYKCDNSLKGWHMIEVLNNPDGSPFVSKPVGGKWHISISHERGIASAVAILED